MRVIAAVILGFASAGQSVAANDDVDEIFKGFEGQYFCTDEVSVGIEWDTTAGAWRTPEVELADRFVVRASFVGTVADNEYGPGVFDIAITKAGTAEPVPCTSAMAATDYRPTVAAFRPIAQCYEADSLREWFIDLGSLRFLRVETGGFSYPGELATPSMTGGICTKIE